MNAGSYRNTKFEIAKFEQIGNGYRLTVSERGVANSDLPSIDVHEDEIGPKGMAKVHDALALLENAAAVVYGRKLAEIDADADRLPAERLHALVKQADEAEARRKAAEEKAEQIAVAAAVERKRLELEAQAAREKFDAEMRALEAKATQARAELEALVAEKAAAVAPPEAVPTL